MERTSGPTGNDLIFSTDAERAARKAANTTQMAVDNARQANQQFREAQR